MIVKTGKSKTHKAGQRKETQGGVSIVVLGLKKPATESLDPPLFPVGREWLQEFLGPSADENGALVKKIFLSISRWQQ